MSIVETPGSSTSTTLGLEGSLSSEYVFVSLTSPPALFQRNVATTPPTLSRTVAYIAMCVLPNSSSSNKGYLKQLEQDRDELLAALMRVAPGALDLLTPEERHQFYKMLRLKVTIYPDGPVEMSWADSPETLLALGGNLDVCDLDTAPLGARLKLQKGLRSSSRSY